MYRHTSVDRLVMYRHTRVEKLVLLLRTESTLPNKGLKVTAFSLLPLSLC